jgi:hypothetical protein
MSDSRSRRTALQVMRDFWRRLRREPQPPTDPFAGRLVPVRRGPRGRSGAAVAEPEDESSKSFWPRKL